MRITIDKKPKKIFTRKFYTIQEAAEILRVHENTIYRLCRSGKLGAYKTSNGHRSAWKIPGDMLEALRVPEIRTGPKPKQKEAAE